MTTCREPFATGSPCFNTPSPILRSERACMHSLHICTYNTTLRTNECAANLVIFVFSASFDSFFQILEKVCAKIVTILAENGAFFLFGVLFTSCCVCSTRHRLAETLPAGIFGFFTRKSENTAIHHFDVLSRFRKV